jgi:hypothetical protein
MSWYKHGDVDIGLVLEYGAGDDGHDGRDQDNHHGQGVVSLPVLHIQVRYQQEGEDDDLPFILTQLEHITEIIYKKSHSRNLNINNFVFKRR